MPDEVGSSAANSDAALLERIAAGEREAFESLVTRHRDAVFRFARALTRGYEDAEDVLQETFLAAYRSAAEYRCESSVRTWLLVIARNAAFRLGRKRPPAAEFDETKIWDLGLRAGWGQRDPESLAIKAQQRERLSAALTSLDAEAREIITLRDLEQLSGEETARVLGLGLEAMKSRLHRARLKLAGSLRGGGLNAG